MSNGLPTLGLLNRPTRVQEYLGLGATKVAELVRDGDLKAVRIGRAVRITGDSVLAYYERLVSKAA